jgi:hypothetical protein
MSAIGRALPRHYASTALKGIAFAAAVVLATIVISGVLGLVLMAAMAANS